jgi:hypothetical protein
MILRSLIAAGLAAASAFALPPLTVIQDVLYKADGTRFNGTLTISWAAFDAVDQSSVPSQVTTVNVVNGNLRVQLVPSTTATPPSYYLVKYSADGRIQFTENWAVPSSVLPLRVRDVRMAPTSLSSTDTAVTVAESDVIGLVSDLGARPLKGPGYSTGRVAWVNSSGSLESVTGSLTDCVRVDGSAGPCGTSGPSFMDNDSPSGVVDGSNTLFTLTGTPNPPGSLTLYRNGMLMKSGQDFSLAANSVAFVSGATPQPGDTLLASYRLGGSGGSSGGPPPLFPYSEVLCTGTGASTGTTTFASLGTCTISAGYLAAGNRLEVHFDVEHGGTAGGYSVELHWGGTTVLHRDLAAGDVLGTARADVAIAASGARLSHQSWGTLLAFGAGVGSAIDDYTVGITIDIQAKVATTGDTVTLKNYTVVRYP